MSSRPFKKRLKYASLYYLIRFFIFISNIIPRRTWLSFCGFLGRVVGLLDGKTRDLSRKHLTLAFGSEKTPAEIETLVKNMFRMLGKNAGELLRARNVRTMIELESFLDIKGYEKVKKAMDDGKGIIFLTAHLGAFDLQIMVMGLKGLTPFIIGTPAKDERLNDLLFEYRNLHGAIAIERGKEMFRLIKGLKKGGSIAILIDQDTSVKSRFVDFFGMPAATPVGAAIFAMKTGAVVFPTYVVLEADQRQHMYVLDEVPVVLTGDDEYDMVENTKNYTQIIERLIRKYPEQWVWMHERWKTKPGQEIV
jgi:Kdo2-lipid IVA lauroyltransferase/acyltransferase